MTSKLNFTSASQVPWPEYKPASYTADYIRDKPWADPMLENQPNPPILSYNQYDKNGKVDRRSHTGEYSVVGGFPRWVLSL